MDPFGSALSFSFSILKKLGLSVSCFKFQLLGKQFCVFSSSYSTQLADRLSSLSPNAKIASLNLTDDTVFEFNMPISHGQGHI
jgi:hypothetical protein